MTNFQIELSVLALGGTLFVVHFFQKRSEKEILTNSRAVSRAATLKRDGGIKGNAIYEILDKILELVNINF